MFRGLFKFFMLMVLLLMAAPAMAQDGGVVVTEVNPVLTDVGAVVTGLVIASAVLGLLYVVSQALQLIYIQVPQSVTKDILDFATKTVSDMQKKAQETDTPLDDLAVQLGSIPLNALIDYLKDKGYGVVQADVMAVNQAVFGGGNIVEATPTGN